MPVIQVHRCRDKVAIYIGTGKTVYLEPKEADEIAHQLHVCSADTKGQPFADSHYTTFNLQVNGEI